MLKKKIGVHLNKAPNSNLADFADKLKRKFNDEVDIEIIGEFNPKLEDIEFKKINYFTINRRINNVCLRFFGPLYYIINVILYKINFLILKKFFSKNSYDVVFISDDTAFTNEILISKFVKTAVIQFTMDSSNVSQLINYIKQAENNFLVRKLISKKFYPKAFRRFGTYIGYYHDSIIQELTLKTLNLLPSCERKGCGKSSFLFVIGRKYKEIFLQYGVESNKIHATSNNRFILLNDTKIEKLSNPKNIKIITIYLQCMDTFLLYGMMSYRDSIERIIKSISTVVEEECFVYMKLHPKQNNNDKRFYTNLLEKYNVSGKLISNEYSLPTLIVSSDLNITMSSTIGLDIMMYKKPLLSYSIIGMCIIDHLKWISQASHIDNIEEDVDEYIRRILYDKEYQVKIIENNFECVQSFVNFDKNPIDNIYKIIKENI